MGNWWNDRGPLGLQLNPTFARQLKPVWLCVRTPSRLQGPAVREGICVLFSLQPNHVEWFGSCMLVILLVWLLYACYIPYMLLGTS